MKPEWYVELYEQNMAETMLLPWDKLDEAPSGLSTKPISLQSPVMHLLLLCRSGPHFGQ